jgi:restriction system protein
MGDECLMVDKSLLPSSKSMINHVVAVISDAGGRSKPAEIDRRLLEKLGISNEAASILHKDGESRTEFSYRSAWARTYCRQQGLISKEPKGFWALVNK